MRKIFDSANTLISVDEIKIDNHIFRLHYTYSVLILTIFIIILSTTQFTGHPVQCTHSSNIETDVMNTFCWIQTTFTVVSAYGKKVGIDIPHIGIDTGSNDGTVTTDHKFHTYYQWVVFTLMFQVVLFYLPRWLWQGWEGGKLRTLTMDLKHGIQSKQLYDAKEALLVNYFTSGWNTHNGYAIKFLICEGLCLVLAIGQMFMMDSFLHGNFFTYVPRVLYYLKIKRDDDGRVSPMVKMFPRVTKCAFQMYGTGGNQDKVDVICILALNIINEKIYFFLWFWFIFIIIMTAIQLLVHIIMFSSRYTRSQLLCIKFGFDRASHMKRLVKAASFGDWYIIYMLGQNMDFIIFRQLVAAISKKIYDKEKRHADKKNDKSEEEDDEDKELSWYQRFLKLFS